ncbi:hypothetical protein D3C87_1827430 [compost metagenome]
MGSITETNILRALARIITDFRFALSRIFAIDLNHRIFEFQARQIGLQWPPGVNLNIQKTIGYLSFGEFMLLFDPVFK